MIRSCRFLFIELYENRKFWFFATPIFNKNKIQTWKSPTEIRFKNSKKRILVLVISDGFGCDFFYFFLGGISYLPIKSTWVRVGYLDFWVPDPSPSLILLLYWECKNCLYKKAFFSFFTQFFNLPKCGWVSTCDIMIQFCDIHTYSRSTNCTVN